MKQSILLLCVASLVLLNGGCHHDVKPPNPPAQLPEPVRSTTDTQSQAISIDDVPSEVSHIMLAVKGELTTLHCPREGQSANHGGFGSAPPGQNPFGSVESSYSQWLQYVADHIRNGQQFDSSYNEIANAADIEIYNTYAGDCFHHSKDVDELQVRARQPVATAGRHLFETFGSQESAVRKAAADYLEGQ